MVSRKCAKNKSYNARSDGCAHANRVSYYLLTLNFQLKLEQPLHLAADNNRDKSTTTLDCYLFVLNK